MTAWKQSVWLAKFEVKASMKGIMKGIITLIASALVLAVFFTVVFSDSDLENMTIVFDVLFLLIFWIVPASFRPKEFQIKKMGGDTWASPYFVMLNQLPITKNVLAMSRFISYFSISIPFYVFLLTLIYAFSSEYREVMSIGSYLVFSIIWIGFGIVFGAMFPASDVGDKMSTMKTVVISVLFYGGLLAILIAFYYVYDQGIVGLTMHAAREWPFLSIVISIILAFVSLLYSKKYVYKRMDKVDYL